MGYFLIIFLTLSHFSIAQPEKGKGDFSLGEIALVVSNLHVGADATIDEPIKNKSLNGSLDIGTLKLGLSKIEVSGDADLSTERGWSSFKFNGPDFELSNVKISTAFDAPYIWGEFLPYRESAQASEAKSVIGNIDNAAKMYYQTYGKWPTDVKDLERSGYLEVDRSTKLKWVFELQLSDQGGRIIATSTGDMDGGEGRVVEFDRVSGDYRGYGTAEREENEREEKLTNLSLGIGKITLTFASEGNVTLGRKNEIQKFSLRQSRFGVSNVSAHYLYDNDRSKSTTFKLTDFSIDMKDIDLQTNLRSTGIDNGQGSFTMKNMEIKIPREIQDVPEFKKIASYLGIGVGQFKIRQIDIKMEIKNGRDVTVQTTLNTQFGKAIMKGNYTLIFNDDGRDDIFIDDMTIEVSNLSRGLSNLLQNWELETGQNLPRKGNKIFLEITGYADKPVIQGIDPEIIRF